MNNKINHLRVGIKSRKKELLLILDFSYEIKNTGLYVLTGISGTGKSYFLGTLYGTYKPLGGEILFNGKNIKNKETYNDFINNIFYLRSI